MKSGDRPKPHVLSLGGVYLVMNYLVVDYSNGLFYLAPAVVGKPNSESSR